jgi:Multicopper oxidase
VNETPMAHPMHLHGHAFQVVAINDQRFSGALRDTVLVPGQTTVTVEFEANNPGLGMYIVTFYGTWQRAWERWCSTRHSFEQRIFGELFSIDRDRDRGIMPWSGCKGSPGERLVRCVCPSNSILRCGR